MTSTDVSSDAMPSAGTAITAPVVIGKPRMTAPELALFTSALQMGRRRYAEFGVGGSSIMAAKAGFDTIVGIESDPEWAAAVRSHPALAPMISRNSAAILHADIGPVGAWGSPKDKNKANLWPKYISTMWSEWHKRETLPDMIFVDGRFRVSCALSALLLHNASPRDHRPPLVLVHDISDKRKHYQILYDYFHIEQRAGTLFMFSPKITLDPAQILTCFLDRLFEL